MIDIYAILAAIGATIAAIGAAWFGGRRSAKTAQKLDALEDKADALETRNEVDNRVARERDARDKLRTDWGQ
jgi:Flp pilus assembly protein TadB